MKHTCLAVVQLAALLCGVAPVEAGWQMVLPSDGILSQRVWDVGVAPDGAVWFLCDNGVSRYDGFSWTNYEQSKNLPGFGYTMARMLVDSRGNVWIASYLALSTQPGVLKFDGETWEPIWTDLTEETNEIFEDRDGNIWFATNYGAVRYDGTDWDVFGKTDGLIDSHVYSVVQDRHGALWFGTGAGVSRLKEGSWTSFTTTDGLGSGAARGGFEDSRGSIWFGTYPISRFDNDSLTTYGSAEAPPWDPNAAAGWGWRPRGFAEDLDGNLWAVVPGSGVVRMRDGVWKAFQDADDPRMTYMESVAVDRDGNVWLATRMGAVVFDGEDWDSLRPGSATSTNSVNDIIEERPGRWWMATLHGLYLYENYTYTVYTTADGLLSDNCTDLEIADDGSLWVCTGTGLSVRDGASWRTEALASPVDVLQHSSGDMYVATYRNGLRRRVGSEWIVYDKSTGLPTESFSSLAEDPTGNLWVASYGYGVGRFDGTAWKWFTTEDGLGSSYVYQVACGGNGQVWAAMHSGGISRFDGDRWTTFTVADGLCNNLILSILIDRDGVVWAGSQESASMSRFDGDVWKTFTPMDGLLGAESRVIREDHAGRIWVGCEWGVAILQEDRVGPQARFDPRPAPVSSARRQAFPLAASFGESKGVQYSMSLDGGPWSDWTEGNGWSVEELPDGEHLLGVRARDVWGNVSARPCYASIVIDGSPPEPVIASPTNGEIVHGRVYVRGTAADPRFQRFRVLARSVGTPGWSGEAVSLLAESEYPVTDGSLALWETSEYPDGAYELRVEAADTLDLLGADVIQVTIDNVAPWVGETSPVVISAALGGDVYSTHGEMHLYFPPHAFAADATVVTSELAEEAVPDTLPGGAIRVSPGLDVAWPGSELRKPVILEISGASANDAADTASLSIYAAPEDGTWRRVGGTRDPGRGIVTASISEPARHALFRETAAPNGEGGLSGLSLTPRVFSPALRQNAGQISIHFTMGAAGEATVTVFNRAGRRVREVAGGLRLNAGANVVRWDGRDDEGDAAPDGLYVVVVEALGRRMSRTLAVTR